ncbi:2685_t:CDS:1, partial [Gigaspora margarita]
CQQFQESVALRKSYYNHKSSTSTNKKIANTSKTNQAPNYEQNDMQTDEVLHELYAELDNPTTNREIFYRKTDTPLETSELSEEEMKAKPSDPLRDELLSLYEKP